MRSFNDSKQFIAYVHKLAKQNNISMPQIGTLYKEIFLDELLERISLSKYKDNFILKGGFLLSSIVGFNSRATEDIDTEIKGFDLTEEGIIKAFNEICQIQPNAETPVSFKLKSCQIIHENGAYVGYRLSFKAKAFEKMSIDLKVDVSTGDVITPREINFRHKLLLENRSINILAYNKETIIAEKLETIISRSILNTRLKDFFDLYLLKKQKDTVNFSNLSKAFANTCQFRKVSFYDAGSIDFQKCEDTINLIKNNPKMNAAWDNYAKSYDFAKGVTFDQTIVAALFWLNSIENNDKQQKVR